MKKLISLILTLSMLVSSAAYLLPVGAEEYDSSKVFVDVPADAWFKEAVDFVASRGIMGGAGQANTFKPSDLSTRSMLAVILHRLEGEPTALKNAPFTDLAQAWYTPAAHWAYESGIVKGSSETTFNPDGKVTRQEIVTMLYRYAAQKEYELGFSGDVKAFEDSDKVASWSYEAMTWALGAGLINGRSDGGKTLLAPEGNTQRSEMATMLSRFISKFEINDVDPLYERIERLGKAELCKDHKAALHVQLGSPSAVSETELGAYVVSSMGLDPTIYSFSIKNGGFEKFAEAYSKVKNGKGALISVSFEVKNLRTLDEAVSFDNLPLYVVRNDWYSAARTLECGEEKITDERINAEIAEFDSLYTCREHGCVHLEAETLTEESFKEAIIGLMSFGASVYKVQLDSTGFNTLKGSFDKLAEGKSASADVTFAITNELIKKECGYESVSDKITVKFSVMKTPETPCRATECPYDTALRATELFERKYVCAEHGKVHITTNYSASAKISDVEALMTEALDLGGFTVKLDSAAFASGKIKAKLTHAKGYVIDGPECSVAYATDKSSRKAAKFTLCENDRDAYKLIVHDGYHSNIGGWNFGQTSSGWIIDTRADDGVRHGAINDVSIFYGSQVIREINNTVKGVIDHRCAITITSGFNGAILDFRNADGDSVVRVQTIDGVWKMLKSDGTYVTVYESAGNTRFVFDFKIDLYENTVRLIINDVNCGTYPLATAGVNSNIQNFRFATTDEDKVSFILGLCEAYVNYSLVEIFTRDNHFSTLPAEWEYMNASISPNTGVTGDSRVFDQYLSIGKDGYVKKSFAPASGKVISQFAILPAVSGSNTEYTLAGGGSDLLKVKTDESSFYVNGKKAYDYVKNVWYYFYLVCDTATGKVQLRINGIDRGEFTLAKKGVAFDTVKVTNSGSDVTYDGFYVYNQVEHSDYVPAPVRPKDEENYTVGINVCSLWQNGFHHGWACITPYDDLRPVLGYYDEGSPETADWEIKYLVEHGVDFQAFCFYTCQETGPITTGNGMHLEDGFKYAKYSNMMKYCLTWETINATKPRDMDAWKNYFVPFLMEHHFKDPRYMTIENKLLFPSFGSFMKGDYWNTENRKEALDYLEEQVKRLGFDGMIYIDVDWGRTATHKSEGIDGIFSYNHSQNGASFEGNKEQIESLKIACEDIGLHYVPTVSTGFNAVGWRQGRTSLISVEEFTEINKWVRDEYLPTSTNAPKWAENLVWMSTWNEYGEGTYMMPAEGLNGFGYLDVLRETYTSEKADPSLNLVPTASQLERINRLYPQHMKLLRAHELTPYNNGIYESEHLNSNSTTWVDDVDLTECVVELESNLTFENGVISNNSDKRGAVSIKLVGNVDLSMCKKVEVYAYFPKANGVPVTMGTWNNNKLSAGKTMVITGSGAAKYYSFNITEGNPENVIKLSLPAGAKLFKVKLSANVFDFFSYELNVLGTDVNMKVLPEISPRGDYLHGFDTIFADLHISGMFTQWDSASKRLTVSVGSDTYEFTVGSAFYKINGVQYYLGYEIYERDGVPMIPLNIMAKRLGWKFDYSNVNSAVFQ